MPKINERIQAGIQYRSMVLDPKTDSENGGACIVEGYASTFSQRYLLWKYDNDEYLEQIDPAAFANTDMGDVIFQYNHEGRVFARTRNNTLELRTDENGLFIHADLGGTEEGRKLYEEIRDGYTDRMSFGFTVRSDKWETFQETRDGIQISVHLRTITAIEKLYDVSAVSIPANDYTSISARSLVDGLRAREAAEAAQAAAHKRKAQKIKIYMEVTKWILPK